MSIEDKAKHPTRHYNFRMAMANAKPPTLQVGVFVLPSKELVPASEICVWQAPVGRIFLTQVWEDGSYNVYYPTETFQVDECIEEALKFGRNP